MAAGAGRPPAGGVRLGRQIDQEAPLHPGAPAPGVAPGAGRRPGPGPGQGPVAEEGATAPPEQAARSRAVAIRTPIVQSRIRL